ncbi:MAG: hypothetical protein FJ098_09570, partial [Deltaproteobacteria bacterium]|nr:hypothetical protein [Deltaproteobacteria bacterium]
MMRARFLICSLVPGLALALAGCPPSLDLGTEPGPDTKGGDTDVLVIPDGVGEACKEAPLPDCKLDGVCGAMNASKFHLVYRCNDDTGEWSCDYDALEGYEKKEVSCDGLDNDCDGTKDEADHVVFEDACPDMNTGVCAADPGSVVMGCVSSGSPVQYRWVCDAAAVNGWAATERFDPQAEEPGLLCDGEDNDCDGDVDEDHASDAGLSVEEVAALPFYKCQPFQGLCAGQIVNDDPYEVSGDVVFRCNGGVLECSYGLIPEFSAPEKACDGLDNDCDGETDEVTDIDLSTCPHSGVCEGKVSALCVDGQWLCHMLEALADPLYQVEESRCDGLDNDCDGETDEGLDWLSLLEARGCPGDCADPICKAWHPDCEGPGTLTFTKDNRCPRTHKNTALPGNPWVPDEDAQGRPVLPGV